MIQINAARAGLWRDAMVPPTPLIPLPFPELPPRLEQARAGIDRIDDAIVALAAARAWLVRRIGAHKRAHDLPARDPARESLVRGRARALAARLALAPGTAERLCTVLIDDACHQQHSPASASDPEPMNVPDPVPTQARLLHLLPPPQRLAPFTRRIPQALQARLLTPLLQQALAPLLASGDLDFMQGRRLGIAVADLGLAWTFTLDAGRLVVLHDTQEAEATIRGSATDLLLMAGRLEDADTLFFQRRLELTGDTELGLTARNLLDRLPFESLPLALRIGLNRGARLARAARAAHRAATGIAA